MREQLYHFLTTESSGNVPVASSILFLLTTPKTNHSVLMSLRRKLREVKLGHSLSSARLIKGIGLHLGTVRPQKSFPPWPPSQSRTPHFSFRIVEGGPHFSADKNTK